MKYCSSIKKYLNSSAVRNSYVLKAICKEKSNVSQEDLPPYGDAGYKSISSAVNTY